MELAIPGIALGLMYIIKGQSKTDENFVGNSDDKLDVLHINTSNDVSYNKDDESDEGNKWLCTIEKYIHSKIIKT